MISTRVAVKTLKIAADETRFKILALIMQSKSTLCVSEISAKINMSQSATSHQLAKLETAGVLQSVRHGQNICYTLKDGESAKKLKRIFANLAN